MAPKHPEKNVAEMPELDFEEKNYPHKVELVWKNIIAFVILHAGMIAGFYILATSAKNKLLCSLISFVYMFCTGLAVGAGAHRLWSHKTYKARLPLRIFLAYFFAAAGENDIIEWSRDHRQHHKFVDTDADPHNINRGFFFAHMGWLMCRKHPLVKEKGKQIDVSDLEADPVLQFQKKYYYPLMIFSCIIVPTLLGWYLTGNTMFDCLLIFFFARYTLVLHFTWNINSLAHTFGTKPYDTNIKATENGFASVLCLGEGWHNYHHVFPWDYKAAEFSGPNEWSSSTVFIETMEKLGLAYDLKTVPKEIVHKRMLRTGDGSKLPISH